MRPISLTFQAFGPYLHETSIDFTAIQSSGLFLISGRTGGGKTSILDAICFALFCRATGGLRDYKQMRCSAAGSDLPTFVDFVFSLRQKTYRFRRVITPYKKRGREEFSTKETHECFVEKLGVFTLLTSGSESAVRKTAEELLHLTCEQFSQVIVLPQGDFLRLLRANSREKAEMLESLFSARRWREILDAALSELHTLEKEGKAILSLQETLLEQDNFTRVEDLKATLDSTAKLLSQQQEKQRELQASRTQAAQRKALAERHQQRQIACQSAVTALNAAAKRKDESATAYETALLQNQASDKLKAEYAQHLQRFSQLSSTLETLKQASVRKKEAERLLEEARQYEMKRDSIVKTIEELKVRLTKGQVFLQTIEKNLRLLPELYQRSAVYRQAMTIYRERSEIAHECTQLAHRIKQQETQLHKQRALCSALSAQLILAEKAQEQSRAFFLAQQLEKGLPCPVCGSLDHPAPQRSPAQDESQVDLPALRNRERDAQASYHRLHSALEHLKQDYETQLTNLERKELPPDFTQSEEETRLAAEALDIEIARLESDTTKADAAKAKLDALAMQLEKAESERQLMARQAATLQAQAGEKRLAAEEAFASLQVDSLETLAEQTQAAEESAKNVKKRQEDIALAYQQAAAAHSAALAGYNARYEDWEKAQGALAEVEPLWLAAGKPDFALMQTEETEIIENLNRNLAETGKLDAQANHLENKYKTFLSQEKRWKEIERAYADLASIALPMSGQNPQKTPIVQFALSIMLDEILDRANQFFDQFSRGRYSLCRSEDRRGGNAYGGLDLEVLDGWMATSRPIETLSGGEQFLASLSLALGLSDIVQNQSSGVALDALFIDEGFGTLDAETLQTAMKALAEIQRSGRLIGLISHVAELRRAIPARIEVQTTDDGFATARVISG